MTPKELAAYVRQQTSTNSTTFTDAEILTLANPIKDELAREILRADEDFFSMDYTCDLQAGVRSYPFPGDFLNKIKRISAKIDGTNEKTLKELDLSIVRGELDEASIVSAFSGLYQYDIWNESIVIYCGEAIIAVSDGLILKAFEYPAPIADLTSTTDMSDAPDEYSNGFPRALHMNLTKRIIAEKKAELTVGGKKVQLKDDEQIEYLDKKRDEAINSLKDQNLDRDYTPDVPDDDGQDY